MISILAAALLSAASGNAATLEAEEEIVVRPREIDDLLPNPGMGWQTFGRFADEDPNLQGLPSSIAYFRFYWNALEPEEGKIDFAMLDGLLAHARKVGQKLAIRLSCVSSGGDEYLLVPKWLKEKGCPGVEFRRNRRGPPRWVPDMDSPAFLEPHLRIVAALGKRYDGHPDLDLVDIGTVGLFGEWHMSGTGVPMPKPETRRRIIGAWLAAFPPRPRRCSSTTWRGSAAR